MTTWARVSTISSTSISHYLKTIVVTYLMGLTSGLKDPYQNETEPVTTTMAHLLAPILKPGSELCTMLLYSMILTSTSTLAFIVILLRKVKNVGDRPSPSCDNWERHTINGDKTDQDTEPSSVLTPRVGLVAPYPLHRQRGAARPGTTSVNTQHQLRHSEESDVPYESVYRGTTMGPAATSCTTLSRLGAESPSTPDRMHAVDTARTRSMHTVDAARTT